MTGRDRSRFLRRIVGAAVALTALAASPSPGQDRPAPVLDLRTRETRYLGPGRETPPPDLGEVRFAWFGPPDAADPDWGDGWAGALLAVEEANAAGGYGGRPFRLLGAWSESPWKGGVSDLVRLVYREGVTAIVGGVDGASTHLAEQVVVKARLPLVSPGGTDPSVNYTAVPWMFTLPPTEDRIAPLLVDAMLAARGKARWAAVTTSDRDTRVAWRAARSALAERRAPAPVLHLALPPSAPDYSGPAAEVARSGARAALVLAGARDAGRLARALRRAGFDGALVVGGSAGRRVFAEEAGEASEGVAFPLLVDPAAPGAEAFARAYRARWGRAPDGLSAHAYDAVRLLVDAVRRAGPNRALVRDALAGLPPWTGAAGACAWDLTGRCDRGPLLASWQGARSVLLGAPVGR